METLNAGTVLSPIVNFFGSRLPVWKKYFFCCRKTTHKRRSQGDALFKCDCSCDCFCSRGAFALFSLGFVMVWIIGSIVLCTVVERNSRGTGAIATYCAVFELTLAIFSVMGP